MQPVSLPLQICMLGSGYVGKSAHTLQFMYDEFVEDYEPTKCSAYKRNMSQDNVPITVEITDTAGQEDYVGVDDLYYRSNDGFVVMFSLIDSDSFHATEAILEKIEHTRSSTGMPPVVLVGNKCDLVDQREVSEQEATALANQWRIPYLETSAKTRYQLKETYETLLRELLRRKQATRQPTEQVNPSSNSCCTML